MPGRSVTRSLHSFGHPKPSKETPVQDQQPRPVLGYMLAAVLVIAALALPLLCAAMTIMESW